MKLSVKCSGANRNNSNRILIWDNGYSWKIVLADTGKHRNTACFA